MDKDVGAFAQSVGAIDLRQTNEFRKHFKRSNYFWLNENILVIKISRSKRPFWGIKRDIVEALATSNELGFYLVLLTSAQQGFLLTKQQVNSCVDRKVWGLASDDNYKINWPLPTKYYSDFSTPSQFVEIIK